MNHRVVEGLGGGVGCCGGGRCRGGDMEVNGVLES